MYYMIRTMHMRSKLDPHKNQHQVCSNSIHPIKLANRFAWCGVHQVYIWTVSFMCSPTHHTHNIHRVALLIFLLNTLAGKQAPNKFSNEIVFMHAILSHKLSASTIDGGSHRIKKTKKKELPRLVISNSGWLIDGKKSEYYVCVIGLLRIVLLRLISRIIGIYTHRNDSLTRAAFWRFRLLFYFIFLFSFSLLLYCHRLAASRNSIWNVSMWNVCVLKLVFFLFLVIGRGAIGSVRANTHTNSPPQAQTRTTTICTTNKKICILSKQEKFSMLFFFVVHTQFQFLHIYSRAVTSIASFSKQTKYKIQQQICAEWLFL